MTAPGAHGSVPGMADFSFILPPGPLSAEGGGATIRQLSQAMARLGHGVHLGEAPGAIRIVDGAALAGLSLDQVAGAIGLIHHTTPLAARDGIDAARADEREKLSALRRVVVTSQPVRDRLAAEADLPAERMAVITPGVPDAPA